MADAKISDLTALTAANFAAGDVLVVEDISVATTKKIVLSETPLLRWTPASSSGAASLDFHEDTDNGTNRVRLIGAASTADVTATLPAVTGTILVSSTNAFPVYLEAACSDETTAISAATDKLTFRNPFGAVLTVTGVRCHVKSACTTGTFTVDINEAGTTILSTKLTLDATEKTSTTAATPAVISDSSIADDAIITVDVDNAGDGTATGLKIVILGTIPIA